ncbi:MAG: hypothetical protein ACE5NC_11790, partial [Anaerolineae bacterium]
MKKLFSVLLTFLLVVSLSPAVGDAYPLCTPEVKAAKDLLSKRLMARGEEVQAPRSLAGSRSELQAPRGQELQAPRGQELQAPRGQEIQAPRSLAGSRSELQAPRGEELQAPRGEELQAPRGEELQAPR